MINLPFQNYKEAADYFGVGIPKNFFNRLIEIDQYCQLSGLVTLDILSDVFGIVRLEGVEARYPQTPIEFFPFGSIGCDGIHYGFIIHTSTDDDYPSGELCPIDGDGVIAISNDSSQLLQALLEKDLNLQNFLPLLKALNLETPEADRPKCDSFGNPLRIELKPKLDWRHVQTSDGVGVFAENRYFDTYHTDTYRIYGRWRGTKESEQLAREMGEQKLFASQLYYLKQLYWHEWSNEVLAKKYLVEMLIPYEMLDRKHLYAVVLHTLETLSNRY